MNKPNLLTIFQRELSAYFNAAIAYIFIIVFVVLNGGLYMTQFFVVGIADMRPFFSLLPYLVAIFLPAITMRLWAEEKRGNTLELLLTFPMRTHELVIGKYLAALVFYSAALASTLTIPIMLKALGNPDMGTIFSGYIGAFLLGSFFLSIGIFISGLCRDQIVAFIMAMIICLGTYILGTQFIASSIDSWLPGFGTILSSAVGSAPHYESFIKGVMDNRDILYYLIGTSIFLALNGFWLEGRMRVGAKKIFSTAVIVSAGIFLVFNWLFSGLSIGRFDLTEGKVYTIADTTKKILRDLKAPVTIKFYISSADKMPTGMKTLEQDVLSKLDEFKIASKGNLNYKIFHMDAANIAEGDAKKNPTDSLEVQLERKGIQPFQIRAVESDEVAVRLIYSSMSIAYKEKAEEIIPRIIPDNLNELEYLVVSKIFRMALPETPKIAVVAPYQEKELDPQMKALIEQMGAQIPQDYKEDLYELVPMALEYEGYQVSRIRLTEKEPIPADVKTLIVIEPKQLNDRQKYEINKFLVSGGSVLLAVQNYMYNYAANQRDLQITGKAQNPSINDLLAAWGFEVSEQILVDESHDMISIGGGARVGPFEMTVPVKVPIQILIDHSGMNTDVSITSRLSPIFYLWGTGLKINDEKTRSQNLKVNTLLKSSQNSWTVPFRETPLIPQNLMRAPESSIGPFPLAIFAQGQFANAYSGKPAPSWPAESDDKKNEEKTDANKSVISGFSEAPGKLILMGAVTPFQKHLLRSGGHINLFLNMVDALALGDDLVGIRSKQPIDRTVGRISAPAKLGWRFFVTFLIPVAIAVIGAFRVMMRRRQKENYLKELAFSGE